MTTLTEEVKNPKRNVLLATVLVCLFAGGVSALEVYLGQLVWPDWRTFSNLETAFMDICRRARGGILFQAMGATVIRPLSGAASPVCWRQRAFCLAWVATTCYPAASSATSARAGARRPITSC